MTTAILPKGANIAMVAPSGIHDSQQLQAGQRIAEDMGYTITPINVDTPRHRYLAAGDTERLDNLVHALTSPDFDGVWMTRGGFGLTRIIDRLPATLPRRPIIGFSDGTALFSALQDSHVCVHGPVIHSLPHTSDAAIEHLTSVLQTRTTHDLSGLTWSQGTITAPIVGGNLAMMASLCGTPHQINATGKILVIEDIGERPYRIDRLLTQLHHARCFDGVVGIAFGAFTDCSVPKDHTYTIAGILQDATAHLGVPVIGNLPIGHQADNYAFVWNQTATIKPGQLTL